MTRKEKEFLFSLLKTSTFPWLLLKKQSKLSEQDVGCECRMHVASVSLKSELEYVLHGAVVTGRSEPRALCTFTLSSLCFSAHAQIPCPDSTHIPL